jgi:pilus assembly protein CpaF
MGPVESISSPDIFLLPGVRARINIVFSGATGAGKTTSLNVYSSYISNDERIITIEDTAELKLHQDHVVRLEARQPNIEGKGEINIRELWARVEAFLPGPI